MQDDLTFYPKKTAMQKSFPRQAHLHLSLIIFLVCLLATFKIWDYYFNSSDILDRTWVSTLILLMGTLFSVATGFLIWTLESGKNYLESEIKRRTEELIEKEREAAAAEAKSLEARRKREEIEEAYRRLQELQAQLIQSEKLASVGRVVAGIVHELNTPLVTMQGYTNMLIKGVVLEDGKSSLELLHRQAERCHKIVRSLLTFSRKEEIHLEPVDLGLLIDRNLEELQEEFKKEGVRVSKKYPKEKVILQADPEQLQKLFTNILVNGCHALQEVPSGQRHITVGLTSAEHSVQIYFEDTGPGIAPENIQKIFEPFFTTKAAGKGTGLGLSLCHGIAAMHGGQIDVHSKVGKGTTFTIDLPRRT